MDYVLNFPEQLGLHLKSLRKAAGLSQSKLAELLQVTQSRVAAIEKDPASVSVGQFLSVLRLLDATLVVRQGAPATLDATPVEAVNTHSNAQTLTKRPAVQRSKPKPLDVNEIAMKPQVLPDGWRNTLPKGSW